MKAPWGYRRWDAILFVVCMLLCAATIPYGKPLEFSADWFAPASFLAGAIVFWVLWVKGGRE